MGTIGVLSIIVFIISLWLCLVIPGRYGKFKTAPWLARNVFLASVVCCLISLVFFVVTVLAYLFQLILI